MGLLLHRLRRSRDAALRAERTALVLYDMGELVGEQTITGRCPRGKFARSEEDVGTDRERMCSKVFGSLLGPTVGVDSNA